MSWTCPTCSRRWPIAAIAWPAPFRVGTVNHQPWISTAVESCASVPVPTSFRFDAKSSNHGEDLRFSNTHSAKGTDRSFAVVSNRTDLP